METSGSSQGRLVDYLILVGPGRGVLFEQVTSTEEKVSRAGGSKKSKHHRLTDWQNISTPVSTILCQFPSTSHDDFELSPEVAYFCQPEGCCIELHQPSSHTFMLTDTESNTRTYGVCLTFPHLFDPNMDPGTSGSAPPNGTESICIQEWGVLSVCILSHHPFFSFFEKCLQALCHFIDDLGIEELSWNALIHAQHSNLVASFLTTKLGPSTKPDAKMKAKGKKKAVAEVEEWIDNLLLLPSPGEDSSGNVDVHALEVELQVDPAAIICYPPKNRFPLLDLPLHRIFQRVGIHLLLEIYKLVLSEQKVILHSSDASFSSECVVVMVSLLYPLQYLYPIIPLLPTAMPTAENLLMVPTPFLIGVCDSFMKKVHDYQVAETWVVSLDSKQVKRPQVLDHPVLEFPLSMLQLQADVRKALDKLEVLDTVDGNSLSTSPSKHPTSQPAQTSSPPTANHTHHRLSPTLLDEVDASLRLAFVQFLFNPEMLELVEQHLCIYRLFPRPVVDLRNSAFLKAYAAVTPDVEFIQELIKTQCVEYFFQYSMNPTNLAFEEIKRGVNDPFRLSDKFPYFVHRSRVKVHQVTLYSPDSLLYTHMLSSKANLAESCVLDADDNSDWEVLTADYYDGDSEISSSSSFYSDEGDYDNEETVHHAPPPDRHRESHHRLLQKREEPLGNILEGESVEVEFHTPRSSKALDDTFTHRDGGSVSNHLSKRTEYFRGRRGRSLKVKEDLSSSPLHHNSPRVHLFQASGSYEGQVYSPYLSDDNRSFLTPGLADGEEGNYSECSSSDVDLSPRQRSNAVRGDTEAGIPRSLNRYTQMSLGNLFASQKEADGQGLKKRGGSVIARGERVGAKGERVGAGGGGSAGTSPTVPVWKTSFLASSQSPLASHALEMQIYDLAVRIIEGQGLPWPKPAYLKRLASQEKTRVLVLRLLEEKLGVREPGDMELATGDQIIAVGVSKAVFKGVLELLRYLLLSVEDEIQKDSETSIFSVFLIFRIAFSTYFQPKRAKPSVIGVSLLNALNLNSFVTPSSPKEPIVVNGKKKLANSAQRNSDSNLPRIAISDANEEMKELHILRKDKKNSGSPRSRKSGKGLRRPEAKKSADLLSSEVGGESKSVPLSLEVLARSSDSASPSGNSSPEPALAPNTSSSCGHDAASQTPTVGGTDATNAKDSAQDSEEGMGSTPLNNAARNRDPSTSIPETPKKPSDNGLSFIEKQHSTPLSDDHPCVSSSSVLSFVSLPSSSATISPSVLTVSPTSSELLFTPVKTAGVSTSSVSSSPPCSVSDSELLSRVAPEAATPQFSPAEDSGSGSSSSLSLRRSNSDRSPIRTSALSKQAILLSDLINSPRFYHPQEGQDLSGCQFVYKDLVRSLVTQSREVFHSKQFWNQLFISTVTVDRGNLGWNEKTAELYTRYSSLTASGRGKFGFEEDTLISVVLHNLLVYMLMLGLESRQTMEMIQRFTARTRLAIGEERLLQQTLKHIEQCIDENDSRGVDINMLGLLSLYSELHPTISYIVHYGTDMLAPVYKLQITDEVLILRRFPDDRICSRLWNDCITIVRYDKARATVSVCYKDVHGQYYHHFHTKQFMKVYESLQALVSPGKVESITSDEETDTAPVT